VTVRTQWRGRVLLVTLDRPARRNAVDHATLTALRDAQVAASSREARVLVLTGAPPAFCAGADLEGVEDLGFTAALSEVLRGFGELPAVCVAAIDGPALGAGMQLAAACDLRVATAESVLGIPAARLGLAVDEWTIERLSREVGWPVTRAMLLAAATSTGEELHRQGFVQRLGPLDTALRWADEIADLAPLTIASHKLAMERSAPSPVTDPDVDDARRLAWASADAVEGRAAFREKRRPRFTGT
jgi:enoyl-CoA hydratase